jgi:hypothetical protein
VGIFESDISELERLSVTIKTELFTYAMINSEKNRGENKICFRQSLLNPLAEAVIKTDLSFCAGDKGAAREQSA